MILRRLWLDEAAFVVSAELVLVATILVIGMIVGLTTVRDQVIQELGDVALHIGQANQSYSFSGITGHHSSSSGSQTTDLGDDCNTEPPFAIDPATFEPACIVLAIPAAAEP